MKKNLAILLFVVACACLQAQESITDGTTPPSIQPGAPAGSYALSGFESVNLYNGQLQVSIPLLKIGGRGEAGYTMSLPIQRNWNIESHTNNGQVISLPTSPTVPGAAFWGSGWAIGLYMPGKMVQRSIVDSSVGTLQKCAAGTVGAGSTFYQGQTLTRLTYIEDDGTEHELRDTLTNGQPSTSTPNCGSVPDQTTNRGTVFTTNDSTSATFIADAAVFDLDTVDSLTAQQNHTVSGWLLFRNGVKYQFNSFGDVVQIQDRNGNYIILTGSPGSGGNMTITDSLNRTISVQYADLAYTLVDTITYPGYNGAQRQINIKWDKLQNAFYPGVCGGNLQNPQTLFPETNPTDGNFNPWVASSITLPDGTSYNFQYNCYGELKRLQLPTGGAFEYVYPYENNSPPATPECSGASTVYGCIGSTFLNDPAGGITGKTVFRRVMERHVLPNGSTIEGRTLFIPTYPSTGTTVQVDKTDAGGVNVLARDMHYFYGDAGVLESYAAPPFYPPPFDGKEYETDRIALETGPTAVAQKSVNTWAQRPCGTNENNCSWIGSPPQIQHDPNTCQTNVTLQEASPNLTSGQVILYDQYNNRTDLYEYDYGSALAQTVQTTICPTSFSGYSRHTSATFLTSGYDVANTGSPSASIHIRNLPTNQTVSDGNGTASKTDYLYDQYGSQSLQDDSGIVRHLAAFNTANTTRGNATTVRKWVSNSTHIDLNSQFDIAGNVVTSYDGNGKPTTITYASPTFAFPTQVCKAVNGSNRCFSQSFDLGSGKLTRRTDLNNVPTTFQYLDALDRPTIAVRAWGTTVESQTLFAYTNSNTVITTTSDNLHFTDTNPIVTQKILDGLGREIESRAYDTSTCNNCYISVQRTYDALGRPYQVSNPFRPNQSESLVYTTTLYDSLSRTKTIKTADGFADSSAIQFSYQNNQTTVTDPAGKDRQTTTNGLGQLSQVYENPSVLNMLTTYTYNGTGSLLDVNQSGQTRTFAYDFLQRLTSARNPENGTVNYTSYDGNGNLLSKTDARNVQWNATFDELNRVSTRAYVTNSTGVPATPQVSYIYDDSSVPYSIGRLTKVNNGSTWQILSYDPLGRPTSSSQTTNGTTYTFPAYAYSRADKLSSITYPSGRVIATNYDDAGRVSQVSSGSTQYATLTTTPPSGIYAYASHGAIRQMTMGNTLIEQTCFNDHLQPTGIRLGSTANGPTDCSNPGSSDLLNLAYDYGTTNNNGNLLSQTIVRLGQTWAQTYSGYDGVNRLTAVSEGSGWSHTYGYDNFGNRAVLSGVVNAYDTPTALSQYTNNRWMGSGASYDSTGNQTALPSRGFTYDAENRLVASVQPNTPAISYSYDGEGRRVTKNVGGVITTYVYDAPGQLAAEYGPTTDSGTSYLTADHLGSTRLLTDANGAVKRCYDYYPFGEDIAAGTGGRTSCFANGLYPSDADTLADKFTSKERDAETGLDFFEARYMSSAQGRFTSPDPVFLSNHRLTDPQAWNLYSYVRNSPLALTDRTGLDFYLDCKSTKDNVSTCQGGRVGTTTTDANGKNTFTPTVVTSASLQDPKSGVTGTVTPGGVKITTASGTYTGAFINGTPAATLRGSGVLEPFAFTITGQQAGNTLEGRFQFNGTPAQAAQYMQSHGAWSYALDVFNIFHPNSNQYRFSDPSNPDGPSIHIALPTESYLDLGPGYGVGLHTRPSESQGDFHVDSHGTLLGHVNDVLDLLKR